VQADLGIVERIVSNLLRNAVEYTPEGGAITCQLERSAQGWWLSLRNPAPSLEAADLQQLGRRFWRKQPEGGTSAHAGLGLALVVALAQAVQWPLHFELEHGCLVVRLGPWPALL
jgi:two-component system sensor histidine kinase QseC